MKNKHIRNNPMRYAGLATQWLVMLLLAVWVGYKIDKMLKWTVPLFLILLPLLSLTFSMIKLVKELNEPKE